MHCKLNEKQMNQEKCSFKIYLAYISIRYEKAVIQIVSSNYFTQLFIVATHVKGKHSGSVGPSEQICILQIFKCKHLEDAFIQNNLQ